MIISDDASIAFANKIFRIKNLYPEQSGKDIYEKTAYRKPYDGYSGC